MLAFRWNDGDVKERESENIQFKPLHDHFGIIRSFMPCKRVPQLLGSLSNHDDDRNKNPTNLPIWQRKTVFFAWCIFHFWHFVDVRVLSTTWNDLFCSCVDEVKIWWQMFKFVFSCPKRWFQFNSMIVRTHFSNIMSLNNWKWLQKRDVTFFVDLVFA